MKNVLFTLLCAVSPAFATQFAIGPYTVFSTEAIENGETQFRLTGIGAFGNCGADSLRSAVFVIDDWDALTATSTGQALVWQGRNDRMVKKVTDAQTSGATITAVVDDTNRDAAGYCIVERICTGGPSGSSFCP